MRISMKTIRLMAALLVAAFLAACENGGSRVSGGRYIEGSENSESLWTVLEGSFQNGSRLVPVEINVTLLDENLDSIGVLDQKMIRQRDGKIDFVSDSVDFPTPYLRIAYACVYPNSSSGLKMEFVQYVDVGNVKNPALSISGALGSERVKTLVQDEGFELVGAKQKALREIYYMLEYEQRRDVVLEDGSHDEFRDELNDYLYTLCQREKSDSAFYANYDKLRSSLGSGKTWRDLIPEVEVADTLLTRESKVRWPQLWMDALGLSSCDSSSFKDTLSVGEKKSAYYGRLLVCDYTSKRKALSWRLLTELETEKGVCTSGLRDTVVFDSLVYICDSAKTDWRNMAESDAVPYLFGKCREEMEGDTIKYDSTYYACVIDRYNDYVWTKDLLENTKLSNPVNIFVRKHAGVCTEERYREMVTVEGKYYQCYDRVWEEVDRKTYFLDRCDETTLNKTAHHDSVGYFKCFQENGGTWKEILIPEYYGDACTTETENYIKEYDGIKFICKVKWGWSCSWQVASDNDLSVPVRHGKICNKENNGEVVEYDGVGYECKAPQWTATSEYHLAVYRAMVRNKFDPEYCRNGSAGTKLFWDDADSALYGCIGNYSDVNLGWGQVRRNANKTKPYAEFDNPKILLEGVYEDNSRFGISKGGWKYTFLYYSSGVNDDYRRYLYLKNVVSESGSAFDVSELDNYTVFRAAIGDSSATLDKIEGKSPSFESYFADWKQKIIESTSCPDATLSGISCVSDWNESELDVKFAHYNENSYTTWNQAKSFCPEGTHIPSAEEWLNQNYGKAFSSSRAMLVKQHNENARHNLFVADYSLFWTSTEKDSDTQYCFEYVTKDEGWRTSVIAGGLVECPKDLYPMVQVVCVNDGEEP